MQKLQIFDELLSKVGVLNKIKESSKTDLSFLLSGASVGEKVLCLYTLSKQDKITYVANDQIEMIEIEQGLQDLGIKYEVLNFDVTQPVFSLVADNLKKHEQAKSLYNFVFGEANILLLNPESLLVKFHQKLN